MPKPNLPLLSSVWQPLASPRYRDRQALCAKHSRRRRYRLRSGTIARSALRIRDDRYFQKACAKVLELRRELAASEDYEQLENRARRLRQDLAAAPIVATSDPLPEAFDATIGRVVPLDGRAGVALLLTFVTEIMSCFGLAGLRVVRTGKGRGDRREATVALPQALASDATETGGTARWRRENLSLSSPQRWLPDSSLKPVSHRLATAWARSGNLKKSASSNVLPLPMRARSKRGEGASLNHAVASGAVLPFVAGPHVSAFVADCLQQATGGSLAASDLRLAYEAWCEANNYAPLSQQKLSAELLRLGYSKWKSCG